MKRRRPTARSSHRRPARRRCSLSSEVIDFDPPASGCRSASRRPRRVESLLGGRLEIESTHGVRPLYRFVLDHLDATFGGRVLVAGSRQVLLPVAFARLHPSCESHFWTFEAWELHRAHHTLRANPELTVHCHLSPDLPADGRFDWVVVPIRHGGERALALDLIRQASLALKPRGKLVAAIDSRRAGWLRTAIARVFGAATLHAETRQGAIYVARRDARRAAARPLAPRTIEARLFDQRLELLTRPGVFSGDGLDDGTLALSEVAGGRARGRVLDLGCGSGALGVAAALRGAGGGSAVLVDSSARAVELARANARRNGAANVLVLLAYDLAAVRPRTIDCVLANPPYFSNYRISEMFVRESRRVLAPGGELLLVTKTPEPHYDLIAECFETSDITAVNRRGYTVLGVVRGNEV